jgi:hypothetical protein
MSPWCSEVRDLAAVGPVVNRLQIHLTEAGNLGRGEEIPRFSDARNHLNWVAGVL